MPTGRNYRLARAGAGVAALAAIFSTSLVAATPAAAEPSKHDIEQAQQRADALYHSAEIASERLNDARAQLHESQVRQRSLKADLRQQQRKVTQMRDSVAGDLVDDYQSGALSTASQVVLSDDPDSFIDNLSAVSAYNTQQGQMLADYAAELKRLHLRKEAVDHETRVAARFDKRVAAEKARLDARAARAQQKVDGLRADLRAALRRAAAARAAEAAKAAAPAAPSAPVASASGRAGSAVSYALAQVGKPYVYGAAGPSAYDCSGLTMAAWATAGVSLPHSASAQYSSGPHIAESQLQPGDLVFYYSPISHVGMYIGNGQIVHAANPSSGVTTAPLHSMPYVGAVRPG